MFARGYAFITGFDTTLVLFMWHNCFPLFGFVVASNVAFKIQPGAGTLAALVHNAPKVALTRADGMTFAFVIWNRTYFWRCMWGSSLQVEEGNRLVAHDLQNTVESVRTKYRVQNNLRTLPVLRLEGIPASYRYTPGGRGEATLRPLAS